MHEKSERISLLFVGEPPLGILGRQHDDRRRLIHDMVAMLAVRHVRKISYVLLRPLRECRNFMEITFPEKFRFDTKLPIDIALANN